MYRTSSRQGNITISQIFSDNIIHFAFIFNLNFYICFFFILQYEIIIALKREYILFVIPIKSKTI